MNLGCAGRARGALVLYESMNGPDWYDCMNGVRELCGCLGDMWVSGGVM